MPLQDQLVALPELAATFGKSEDWLRRNWQKLHEETGFPRKCALGWVWPRRLVELWINGEPLSAPVPADRPPLPGVNLTVANQNEFLRKRFGRKGERA